MTTEPELHPKVAEVTANIIDRSRDLRAAYLDRMDGAAGRGTARGKLSCANFAHAFAASPPEDKIRALDPKTINIGVVTAYNDMLSAHQPFERYPDQIREAAREVGATVQVAGGVPAMCDGVTQGREGMELSLFSRDVIALSTAIALTHDAFDAAICLGVCDKIAPGMVIGALSFGHLPVIFAPAGPMSTGASNAEKARVRGLWAEGKIGRDALLASEMASYHGPGTCTFYGTANSNQMLLEMMGLHLPGAAFVHPHSPLRQALTRAATQRMAALGADAQRSLRMASVVDAKAIVNACVGLLATGGSTNHTLHLPAMARAAGVILTWEDLDALSEVVPLMARIYPNGSADVNAFQAAGGMGFVIGQLLDAGLAHNNVTTVMGHGLRRHSEEPFLQDDTLIWRPAPTAPLDRDIVRPVADPFDSHGGIRLMRGNLGRAVAKVSSVKPENRVVEAPAAVFDSQTDLIEAFQRGELNRDVVVVVRFQGPRANGMPELHSLTPSLGVLMDRGYKVGLVTDGRMSGASGKVLAAIHLTPEAVDGGPLARVQNGDVIRLDALTGTLEVHTPAEVLAGRPNAVQTEDGGGSGRELFAAFRRAVSPADHGAAVVL